VSPLAFSDETNHRLLFKHLSSSRPPAARLVLLTLFEKEDTREMALLRSKEKADDCVELQKVEQVMLEADELLLRDASNSSKGACCC
jgi:hypothetical protein